jgi:hypothetical protein
MSEEKKNVNIVKVEGILSENKLDYKQTTDGREYISGDLLIEVSENNIVPVNFFTFKTKKDGGPNKIYSNLENVINTFKSIAKHGKENADRVRVTGGNIEGNEFYNAAGNLISTFRIRSNFVNKVNDEFKPQAGFQVEVFIQSIVDEIKDDTPTDRLQIIGVVPMYGGKVSVVNFYADNAQGIEYMKKNYSNGDTVKLVGRVDNEIIEITKTEEMEFGDDVVTTYNRIKRELIITQGTKPYEDAKALDPAEIKKAMIQREVALKEQLEVAQAKATDMGTGGFANDDVPF